jgi:hypothetical protein
VVVAVDGDGYAAGGTGGGGGSGMVEKLRSAP